MDILLKEKILFIRTDFLESKKFKHPLHFVPPMTLKYAKSLLEEDNKYDIEIIDCCIEKTSMEWLISKTLQCSPRAIVVSTSSFGYEKAWKFVKAIKNNNSQILIIGIGHDVTSRSEVYLSHENPFDIILCGEAEQEIAHVIRSLKRITTIDDLKRFYNNQANICKINISYKLDDLPFPRFTKEELKKYIFIYPVALSEKITCGYIISSRGCNHNCVFCAQAIRRSYTNNIRLRDASNIVDEIEELRNKKVNLVYFMDDNFSTSREHIFSICNKILARRIDIKWVASVRVDEVGRSLLEVMKKAGCILLLLSVESGSERIIRLLNKTQSPETWIQKAKTIFYEAKRIGISTCALFMVGNPTESKEDVEKSIRLVKTLNPDFIKVHFFTPYPGTAIYEKIKEKIDERKLHLMHHYLSPVVNLSDMDMDTLKTMQLYFYKKFILRPSYIVRHLVKYSFFYLHNAKVFKLLFTSFFLMLQTNQRNCNRSSD